MALRVLLGTIVVAVLACERSSPPPVPESPAPVKAEIRRESGRYVLHVDGRPFYIKGAGLEFGDVRSLAGHGANAFRTWRTENGRDSGRDVLDRAFNNGIYVVMGLEIGRERHGFDYDDDEAVANQMEAVRAEIIKYKDHPALIMWAIGNELNLLSKNPKVWDAVNDISKMIHRLDANHLTLTTIAGIGPELIREIKARAPDLDLLGIQMYADIVNLPRYLRESGWDGPYIVTEWGATGHWEVGKTAWGAPIENDSQRKADLYLHRYNEVIRPDRTQCLGSFVFLWGQKQERTPTWYGLFLESGEETAAVDVMHYIWNDRWPANRSPRLESVSLDGRPAEASVRLRAGDKYSATVAASDPDGDELAYRWEILEESTDLKMGGDSETRPRAVEGVIEDPNQRIIRLVAPERPGPYRLFVYVFDGNGHAAHANIPFYVDR